MQDLSFFISPRHILMQRERYNKSSLFKNVGNSERACFIFINPILFI